jgi:hypothetical protein
VLVSDVNPPPTSTNAVNVLVSGLSVERIRRRWMLSVSSGPAYLAVQDGSAPFPAPFMSVHVYARRGMRRSVVGRSGGAGHRSRMHTRE